MLIKQQKAEAESLGADSIVAIDDDTQIATLPELDAIADTVDGDAGGGLGRGEEAEEGVDFVAGVGGILIRWRMRRSLSVTFVVRCVGDDSIYEIRAVKVIIKCPMPDV